MATSMRPWHPRPTLTHLSRRMEQAWIEVSRAEQRRANTAECEQLYDDYLTAMDEYVRAWRRATAVERETLAAEQILPLPSPSAPEQAVQSAPPVERVTERYAGAHQPEHGEDYERGQRAVCAAKKAYPSEKFAKAVGRREDIVAREGHALRAYQCPWCSYWHLSSSPGRQQTA